MGRLLITRDFALLRVLKKSKLDLELIKETNIALKP
jgi:hypothetical protein